MSAFPLIADIQPKVRVPPKRTLLGSSAAVWQPFEHLARLDGVPAIARRHSLNWKLPKGDTNLPVHSDRVTTNDPSAIEVNVHGCLVRVVPLRLNLLKGGNIGNVHSSRAWGATARFLLPLKAYDPRVSTRTRLGVDQVDTVEVANRLQGIGELAGGENCQHWQQGKSGNFKTAPHHWKLPEPMSAFHP
jgi:hypothetical protein